MRRLAASLAILLSLAGAASAAPHVFTGRRLDEALAILQREGLPIVFSSEIVTPAMRVVEEPRAATPRDQLDELLAAQGLRALAGPGRTILVIRDLRRPVRESAAPVVSAAAPEPPRPSGDPPSYIDRITVRPPEAPVMQRGSQTILNADQIGAVEGPLDTDAMDSVRTLPGVVAGDDFRTDFSVRGSPYSQIGVVTDGVETKWLQYTMYGRRDAGSLSMIGSDLIDRVTLQSGAYPRLYAEALGAEVDLTIKEGSREATRFTGAAGGLSAAAAGEGPIGRDRRGSWRLGVRESYQAWPGDESGVAAPGFGFADLHGKLVYDASPSEQISVTALAGRSTLDATDQSLGALYGSGTDTAGLVTAGLRSTLSATTFFQQRVYFTGQTMASSVVSQPFIGHVANNAIGYRGEAFRALFGGLLHGGLEFASRSGSLDTGSGIASSSTESLRAAWMTRSAFVNLSGNAPHGVAFQIGARISDSTLVQRHAFSPWALGRWRLARGWTVVASAGESHQFPELDAMVGQGARPQIVPEQATHVDLGIENHLTHLDWHTNVFERFEHSVLRPPTVQPWPAQSPLLPAPASSIYENAFQGSARGIEVGASMAAVGPASGWLSYTYSLTHQTDLITGETFWADLDRRHAMNMTGFLRLGQQTGVGLTLRAASGVPVPGYFTRLNGLIFAGDQRNQVRLPPYARLDLRARRAFFASRHSVTISAEVLNLLNRSNVGIGDGIIQPLTGEAVGFTKPLEGRQFALGIGINLSR